jgi:aldehyde:ferredoxin oxidoreductase
MNDPHRYPVFGDLLHVDLSDRSCTRGPVPESSVARLLGGRGFNVGYLFAHLPTGTDPMGPDNMLVLSCGLLTGTRAPTASRLHINALSPLTGLIGSSNVGGYAGAWLRSTGIVSLVIRGRSSTPVYLYISESHVEIRDATPYWGLDAIDTQDRIAGDQAQANLQILSIGTAGESGARFACIVTGKDHAAGRTGLGTVMGAKHLKAVVINKGSVQAIRSSTPAHRWRGQAICQTDQGVPGLRHLLPLRWCRLHQVGRRHGRHGHPQLPPKPL